MVAGLIEKLARFAVNSKDILEQAVEKAKIMFLDTIGVALAGAVVGGTGMIARKYV